MTPAAGAQVSGLYRGGRFYQMLHGGREHDLPHYLSLLQDKPATTVLELGVGVGRVALALADAGATVCGVDNAADMLALLRREAQTRSAEVQARCEWLEADMLSLQLERRFDLVLCPFNCLGHLHTPEQLAAFFSCVRRHLQPGGWLGFDVALPPIGLLAGDRHDIPWFRHPDDGSPCRYTETSHYDPHKQLLRLSGSVRFMTKQRTPEERILTLRQFFPQETELLIRHHGFELVRPMTDLDDTLAYVCRVTPG